MNQPRSKGPARKAIGSPKAEEQAPSARQIINRSISDMPYSSLIPGLAACYLREEDSDEKALERLANYLEAMKEMLERIAAEDRQRQIDLSQADTLIAGLHALGKALGLHPPQA